jgi:putative MATE family efflux protein
MTVDGVAIATIISQYLSAIVSLYILWLRRSECYGLSFKKLCIDKAQLKRILMLGVPAALQNAAFSLSNVLLVSGVNSLGDHAIKAYTIAGQVDSITYIASTSFGTAAMVFTGQNYGAKKYERIKRVLLCGIIQSTIFGVLAGVAFLTFSDQVASLFISATDPNRTEVLALTKELVTVIQSCYFLCGIMGIVSSVLRGMGYSISPMITAIACICGIRIVWIYTVFQIPQFHTPEWLYISYVISWLGTFIFQTAAFIIIYKKRVRADKLISRMPEFKGEIA